MSEGVRETTCSSCEHRCVCQFKEKYLVICDSIKRLIQNFDVDFIKPVEPMRKYYKKAVPTPRSQEFGG